MPNIATVLKQEIARLARKEVKSETAVLKRSSAQYRSDIAKLKRRIETLEKKNAYLEKRQETRVGGTATRKSTLEGIRFSARSVRAQRKRLNFSADDYGKLIGVSGQTIYMWEQGKSRPRKEQFTALVAVRGLGKREAIARLNSKTASNSSASKSTKKKKKTAKRGRKKR